MKTTRRTAAPLIEYLTVTGFVKTIQIQLCHNNGILSRLEHKQMYYIRTNLQRFQPSNVNRNIRNIYTSLHNGVCC